MPYSRFLVADLLRSPGSVDDVDVSIPLEMQTDCALVEGEARGSLRLEAAGGGLVARGKVAVGTRLTCRRCLSDFVAELAVPILQVYGSPDVDDSLPIAPDGRIDLESAVRDEVGLALPLAPLCRPDCKGLCDTCGTDLNTDPCEGHPGDAKSPFASLEGLFRPD